MDSKLAAEAVHDTAKILQGIVKQLINAQAIVPDGTYYDMGRAIGFLEFAAEQLDRPITKAKTE